MCSETGPVSEGTWNSEGVILFTSADSHLRRVDEDGGECTPVFEDDPNLRYGHPLFLPDGKRFLYLGAQVNDLSVRGVYAATLDDPTPHRVLQDLSETVYVPANGNDLAHILFRREGALMAQAFDEGRLEPVGDPFQVASQVASLLSECGRQPNQFGLFEVAIQPDGHGGVRTGTSQRLFTFRGQAQFGDVFLYAPHPDGERFLVNVQPEPTPNELHVIPHWRPEAPR